MQSTGIRELKANLSRYLRKVRAGENILITDRGQVVAELRRPGSDDRDLTRYQSALREGRIAAAVRPDDRSWTEWNGVGAPEGLAAALLDEDRRE